MTDAPSISGLLRSGAREWNKRRNAGGVPVDHTGATLKQIFSAGADLSELTLIGTEWQECELAQVSFRDADLSNAYFHGGVLVDCNFNGANLDGATFENLKLVRCDFSYAYGLDNLELSRVETKNVEGLGDIDRSPAALRHAQTLGADREESLEELVLLTAMQGLVVHGDGATQAEVEQLEATLGTSFPEDYRAFLLRFGHLRIESPTTYAVFGIGDLEATYRIFREEFDRWVDPGWRDAVPPVAASPELSRRRAELREQLRLSKEHVQGTVGDAYDMLRIAYTYMVPIMGDPEDLHQAAACIGPGSRIYSVSIKGHQVEPPRGTFTSWLAKKLKAAVREAQ